MLNHLWISTTQISLFAPRFPVAAQAATEGLRLLRVEPATEVERIGDELLLAPGDRRPQSPGLGLSQPPFAQVGAEQGEVVVVAEQVGQTMGFLGGGSKRPAPGTAEEPQLIPEVLGPFPPLVK